MRRISIRVVALGSVLGLTACLTVALSAGCASRAESGPDVSSARQPVRQPRPSPALVVKPEGVEYEMKAKVGPPPPGHPRIVGEPMPNWEPAGAFEPRGLSWRFLGPNPISSEYWSGDSNASGRVVSIATHPSDPNVVYIASASGGVWKTTDGGLRWTPLTDELSILNHGAVALDPSDPDVVYVGTGEYQTGSSGDGIFRSTDAGTTWQRIATAAQVGPQVSAIVVSHENPDVIHATTSLGYYRSTDGGATWSQRLSGSCSSIVMHPTDADTLFVGRSGGSSRGVYRSINGGDGFIRLSTGLPASGSNTYNRVLLDLSRSNPQVIYAAIVNGGSGSLYRSADGGVTWTQKTATPNFCSPQCWYDAYVAVDPADENRVFLGGVDPRYAAAGVIRSTNGGDSWTEISNRGGQLHPDHHVMKFGPTGIIWEGNDGGVWKSTTGGDSWINCNADLGVTQIYNIVQHPTQPDRMLGGTQDNGTPERTANNPTWPQLQAGDGGFSIFDPYVSSRRYTTYVYLSIYRWSSGSSVNISGPWGGDATNWISPLIMDPNSNQVLLAATNRVWRTTNATAPSPTWTAISTTATGNGSVINAVDVPKADSRVIYVGYANGRFGVTTDGGATWQNRSAGLPGREISDVLASSTDPGTVYVGHYSTTGGRLYRSTNFGVTWENVTGSLPSGVSVRALEIDFDAEPDGIYVGSGHGVYASFDGGATWTKDDASLPNVNTGDLTLDPVRRTITVGTYGRGAWMADLPALRCAPDFNGDGFLDFFDADAFVECFEGGACPPGKTADFNGDGFVDFFDFDDFMIAFDAGC